MVGLAAAAAGIVYLTGKEQSWSDLNNTLTTSVDNLTQALDQQHTATGTLAAADQALAAQALAQVTKGLEALGSRAQTGISLFGHAADITNQWSLALDKQIASLGKSDPLLTRNLSLLQDITTATGQIPTRVEIDLLINNKDPTATLGSILGDLQGIQAGLQTIGAQPTPYDQIGPITAAVTGPLSATGAATPT